MAKKKENKAIGYIILSFIPLFGIVWAAVAGIQHNGYVKEAKEAEIKFEQKLLNIVTEFDEFKDANLTLEEINITYAKPIRYETRLSADNVTHQSSPYSYTIALGANPVFETVDGVEEFKAFSFNYEFFVTSDEYQTINENFSNDKLDVIGTADYLFETYYPNNPKASPVYAIEPLLDKYYKNILVLEVNGESLIGLSASTVIDMIAELPSDIEATKEAVSGLNNSIKKIESEMKILGEAKVEQITNLEKLEEARSLYNVRNVEYLIKEVPFAVADFKLTTEKKMTTAKDAYEDLTEEEKPNVDATLLANLALVEFEYPMWKVTYYVGKANAENAAKFYNLLTSEQKADYKADGLFEALSSLIETYNSDKADDKKLSLQD